MITSWEHPCFNEDDSDKPGLNVDRSKESFISKNHKNSIEINLNSCQCQLLAHHQNIKSERSKSCINTATKNPAEIFSINDHITLDPLFSSLEELDFPSVNLKKQFLSRKGDRFACYKLKSLFYIYFSVLTQWRYDVFLCIKEEKKKSRLIKQKEREKDQSMLFWLDLMWDGIHSTTCSVIFP